MNNQNNTYSFTEGGEIKELNERFVEALILETQSGGLLWCYENGYGSSAFCVYKNRKLIVVPDFSDPNADGYSLCSSNLDGHNVVLLMSIKSKSQYSNLLRNLYQDIAESISDRNNTPTLSFMEGFVRETSERLCLYAIIDAVNLLQSSLSVLMQNSK